MSVDDQQLEAYRERILTQIVLGAILKVLRRVQFATDSMHSVAKRLHIPEGTLQRMELGKIHVTEIQPRADSVFFPFVCATYGVTPEAVLDYAERIKSRLREEAKCAVEKTGKDVFRLVDVVALRGYCKVHAALLIATR